MRTFTDSKGRSWVLAVDGWSVRQIKRDSGYQILDAINPEKTLFNDAALVVEVLWILCKKQADVAAISEEDFCRSIHGDSLEESTEKLGLEVIDFLSNRARARTATEKYQAEIEKQKTMDEQTTDHNQNGSPATNSIDSTSSSPELSESSRGGLPSAS